MYIYGEESQSVYNILLNIMIILSIITIIVVALQPTKTSSSSNAFMGGSELFNTQKARGFEAFLLKVTIVCLILFFILAFTLQAIS